MSSSEEKTSPVKGRAFKAHIKDKEKQKKPKMVREVADNKIAKRKDTAKEKKYKVSKDKGAKDWTENKVSMLIELLEEKPSFWDIFNKYYSKLEVKDATYKEIADVFACNITSVKGKINTDLKRRKWIKRKTGKIQTCFIWAIGAL